MVWNFRFSRSLGALSAAGLFLVGAAASPTLAYDPTARFSIAGQAGASSVAMGDVNDEIGSAREYMRQQNWTLLDEIGFGFNFLFDVRADVFGPWMVSLGVGHLSTAAEVDFDEVIDVKPTTNFLQARALYRLPWRPKESVRFALGGGVVHASSGQLEISHEQRSVEAGTERIETLTMDASGWGGLGCLEAELVLSETFTLVGDVGYRYLRLTQDSYSWSITEVDDPAVDRDGDEVPEGRDLSDRSILRNSFIDPEQAEEQIDVDLFRMKDIDLDFSGVTANVGLRIYIF